MKFNTARNTLAIMFYGTEEGKKINSILNQVDENPWHTGTPTECNGWYLVMYKHQSGIRYIALENPSTCVFTDDSTIAWQKIEPYTEASE